jgi:hypothetical protein
MKTKYTFYTFFILIANISYSQHVDKLGPIRNREASNHDFNTLNKVSIDSLNLPFVEDFSTYYYSSMPDPKKFIDQHVYINNELAANPPSIGFATFDGLNANGNPYVTNTSGSSGGSIVCDYLTSNVFRWGNTKPIPSDSIYLSFYYKAKGLGYDSPDKKDSIILEFKNATTGAWKKIWSREGYSVPSNDTNFKQVMIPIKDTAFLKRGFQFRFKNKGNGTGVLDLWHIDYIYIRNGRYAGDLNPFVDVAFKSKKFKVFKQYHNIPFQQYQGASDLNTQFENRYKNLKRSGSNSNIRIDSFNFAIKGPASFKSSNNFGCDIDTSDKACLQVTSGAFNYVFPIGAVNAGRKCFDLRHYISASASNDPNFKNYKQNDTMYQKVCFDDYFALDDGSAEQAYYLDIPNTGLVGKFELNKDDTLRGLDLFFLPVINNLPTINNQFKIKVYQAAGNQPGGQIYEDTQFMQPFFTGGYGKYQRYILSNKKFLTAGTYFIGFDQKSDSLQIGFDVNTNNKSNFFYRVSANNWVNISYDGTPMIRPAFGDFSVGLEPISIEKKDWKVFPNPASENLVIQHAYYANTFNESYKVELINLLGQIIYQSSFRNNNEVIDIKQFTNGFYFVKIYNNDKLMQQSFKIQIKH